MKKKKSTLFFMEISDSTSRHERAMELLKTRPNAVYLCFEQLRQMLNPPFFREADMVAMAGMCCMMHNCFELGKDIILDICPDRPQRYTWLLNEARQAKADIRKITG